MVIGTIEITEKKGQMAREIIDRGELTMKKCLRLESFQALNI